MDLLDKFKNAFAKNKSPIIKDNTFIIWEPCSSSHAEIVPGYAKYLLDLGYHVSILVTPERLKEGLFARFNDENLSLNSMTQKQIKNFFLNNDLRSIRGVLVTTVGKLCDNDIDDAYKSFHPQANRSKVFFVEHEIDKLTDNDKLPESIITLRKMDYKNATTTVVNPHYFGKVKLNKKNTATRFVTIGALSEKRKSTQLLVNAVENLVAQGITNFKVVVIGKGKISKLPKKLRAFFDIKGKLPFDKMYDEIEKSDFILSAYENTLEHKKYITIKTSGTFQLAYGFLKPIIIKEEFATINGFEKANSILYKDNDDYASAMKVAIEMSQNEYSEMQKNLENLAQQIYYFSKQNLMQLINTKGSINE